MKKIMLWVILVCSLILAAGSAGAATMFFNPANQSVLVGDSFSVDLMVGDLGTDLVGGFLATIGFDASILSFTGVSFGSGLGDNIIFDISAADIFTEAVAGVDASLAGIVKLEETSWLTDLSFQSDSFILATLNFTGIGLGQNALTLFPAQLTDAFGVPLDLTATGASVNVVPEPATLWLLGAGLVGLVGCTRKKLLN